MKYTMKAHPTLYNGVLFRSRLEARWAAFFDLCKIEWQYEPVDLHGWTPDFRLKFLCGHSDCPDYHTLFVEVKPYSDVDDFRDHPCMSWTCGWRYNDLIGEEEKLGADGAGGFGINPEVTVFEIAHGAGGGLFDLPFFLHGNTAELWKRAGNIVQWHAGTSPATAPKPPKAPLYLGGKPSMEWLLQAAKISKAAVTVGIALWFKHGLKRGVPSPIRVDASLRRSMGLSRDQARRGMHALAEAGLLKIELGGRGRCAQVTIINDLFNNRDHSQEQEGQ